ncbi:hypothetical protein AL755_13300 [Arthrobacter sp. ERGS1:01]|nr:hypothetical protein AL755_13300 [Arthrobacter sp. ERGS1:01]
MMFPKKGQIWTYRERGRFLSVLWGIPLIVLLIFGIYLAAAKSNWLVLIVSFIGIVGLAMFFFSNDRSHRGEP